MVNAIGGISGADTDDNWKFLCERQASNRQAARFYQLEMLSGRKIRLDDIGSCLYVYQCCT